MLNIPVFVVRHFVTILAVLCEKEVEIIVEAFEAFCNEFLDWFYSNDELNWNHQNPTVYKIKIWILFYKIRSIIHITYQYHFRFMFPIFTVVIFYELWRLKDCLQLIFRKKELNVCIFSFKVILIWELAPIWIFRLFPTKIQKRGYLHFSNI